MQVKLYPDGLLSPYLHSLQPGAIVSVHGPIINKALNILSELPRNLILIAAGTGIAPMIQVCLMEYV